MSRSYLGRFRRRWTERLKPMLQSDTAFVEGAYREVLGRPPDQGGLDHYRRILREGVSRTTVLLQLMRSDEFRSTLQKPSSRLPNLREERCDRYRSAIDRENGQTITVFHASEAADVDWLEAAILQNDYYELPGVWTLGVDVDKRVIAEIVASFCPVRGLELGCAAGAVLECLDALGIFAEGVEISSMALSRASTRVRSRIHHGDVLQLDLSGSYDLVFGLDIFEHLNPNRINAYMKRLWQLLESTGYVFCNIPAFGPDPVFGTVFPLYVEGWESDAAAGRPFSLLHVDDRGYPLHGHLTWADTTWWVSQFEAQGFRREDEIERALHRKYDHYMEKRSPARKAYYVFSKDGNADRSASTIERISQTASRALTRS
jgi:hypothetical protein